MYRFVETQFTGVSSNVAEDILDLANRLEVFVNANLIGECVYILRIIIGLLFARYLCSGVCGTVFGIIFLNEVFRGSLIC